MKQRAAAGVRAERVVRRLGRGLGRICGGVLVPACVVCRRGLGASGAPVCYLCWHRLPAVAFPRCSRCGAHARAVADVEVCADCEGWPSRVRARAPYRFEDGSVRLVHALKYEGWTKLGDVMGRALAPDARALLRRADAPSGVEGPPILVPVPLTAARRRARGFNQAELLAEGLSVATGWSARTLLARARAGRRQTALGRPERERNVAGGFAVRREAALSLGRPLLLVDDVVTTGATAAACLSTLAAAGLFCVGVVSFARATRAGS